METITPRRGKRGVIKYRVRIRSGSSSQSATFDTRKAAEQWADIVGGTAKARKLGLVGDDAAAPEHTLADAVTRYRRQVLPSKAASTQDHYELHLAWWRRLGSTLLTEITPQQITTYRDRLARTLEPSTVNGYLASLSAVMTVAMMD